MIGCRDMDLDKLLWDTVDVNDTSDLSQYLEAGASANARGPLVCVLIDHVE